MTKEEYDAVLATVRSWPREKLEDAATTLLTINMDVEEEYGDLTPEELAELDEASAAADRGEFASEEEMKALFDLCRRG
jgi:hypothetical protein